MTIVCLIRDPYSCTGGRKRVTSQLHASTLLSCWSIKAWQTLLTSSFPFPESTFFFSFAIFLGPALNCALTSVYIIRLCMSVLPLPSPPHKPNVVHHCHITTRCLGSFSSAPCRTFTPIVQRGASCNQSWLFVETSGNRQRPKLSSPAVRVVTVRVRRTKSNRHLFGRVASCRKSRDTYLSSRSFPAIVYAAIDCWAVWLFVLNYASSSCICVYSLINLCVRVNSPFWPECLLNRGPGVVAWVFLLCLQCWGLHREEENVFRQTAFIN